MTPDDHASIPPTSDGWPAALPDRSDIGAALAPLQHLAAPPAGSDSAGPDQPTLILLVDNHPTMRAWQPTVVEFRHALAGLGVFRSIRDEPLDTAGGVDAVVAAVAARPPPDDATKSVGRPAPRIVAILTDGLAPFWAQSEAGRLLHDLGLSAATAIVNPYPQGYWHRTHLECHRVRLRAQSAGAPNHDLQVDHPPTWRTPYDRPAGPRSVPVPVVELSARWMARWTELLAGSGAWLDATVVLADPDAGPSQRLERLDVAGEPELRPSADVVRDFRSWASPTAFYLATLCAAAPLSVELLHEIQRELLPGSRPFHLAEVLTSDLVREQTGAEEPELEFLPGVREALLACSTRDDSVRVLHVLARQMGDRLPEGSAIIHGLESPHDAPVPPVTAGNLATMQVVAVVLRALSTPYADWAAGISQAITVAQQRQNDDTAVGGDAIGPALRDSHQPNVGSPPAGPFASRTPLPIEPGSDADPDSPPSAVDEHEPGRQPVVWGDVPLRNQDFTGREYLLEELHRRLTAESVTAVLPQALHGMGGVGKSQIAIEYAHRRQADYDVVWWIPAEQPAQVLSALIALGNRLGLSIDVKDVSAIAAVQEALQAGAPYSNWLLVFDNAESLDHVRPYLPSSGAGKVIVTSRNPEWSRAAGTLEVDVFTRAESIALLRRRMPDIDPDDADRIATVLGDLPLAVEHASAWLATTGTPVEEYLRLLAAKRSELLDQAPSPGYEVAVATAWNVALDRLGVENPPALQLLQLFAFFAPEPIALELFTGPRVASVDENVGAALHDPRQLRQAIRDIQRYGLARIEHRTNTVHLHRLVRAVLVGRMSPREQRETEHGAHVLLAGGNPGSPDNTANWPRYQALLPHVVASNAIDCVDAWTRQLVLDVARFLAYWGEYTGGRDMAQAAVSHWRADVGPDDQHTLEAAKLLGYVLWLLGDFEAAAQINADCRQRYERVAGSADEGTLDAMGRVAADLRTAGEFSAARDLDQEVVDTSRRVFGDDEPITLRAAHNLGVSLRLTGEFPAARRLDTDTYQRRVNVLGRDHPETLWTLNGLTLDLRECGEYLEAHRRQERLYDEYHSILGLDHPHTIAAARNLAVARRRAGRHELARKLSDDTRNRLERRYGAEHPATIAATLDFAVDLREAGDLNQSLALAALTQQQYERVLGAGHPYALYARTNLAVVLRLAGELEIARDHDTQAWETLRHRLGPDHILTLTCATNLASDLSALGDHERAHELSEETTRRSRQALGVNHPSTLACSLNLSLDLAILGRSEESDRLYNDTLARFGQRLGDGHPAVIAAGQQARADCDVDPMPL